MKKETVPEQLFYDRISTLINNLLIDNINYKTGYYYNRGRGKLMEDTIERATYILHEMDEIKHLINLDEYTNDEVMKELKDKIYNMIFFEKQDLNNLRLNILSKKELIEVIRLLNIKMVESAE